MSEWESDEGEHWATNADRYSRMLSAYGDIVASAASLQAGQRVLDIGCGNGDLTVAAANEVGPTGSVLGVDLSPAMLSVARSRANHAGLGNVTFEASDVGVVQPAVTDFDVAVSRFGVMFFSDPAAAFAHIRSLMRPGGRLVFVCWQDLFANEWMITPGAAVAGVLGMPGSGAEPGAPGPFAFADPDRPLSVLQTAGYTNPTAEAVTADLWMGENAAAVARFMRTTGMGRAMFANASPELAELAVAKVTEALEPFESDTGVTMAGAAWLITATA